jgi:hypothetical protein
MSHLEQIPQRGHFLKGRKRKKCKMKESGGKGEVKEWGKRKCTEKREGRSKSKGSRETEKGAARSGCCDLFLLLHCPLRHVTG